MSKTITVQCTWTNDQQIEVPDDWDGRDIMLFADQVTSNGVDLYDMEAVSW